MWPPLPHSDEAGWARVQKIGPYFTKHLATCGAGGISKTTPIEMANYPYPIYTVYASQPEDQVYNLTKAMILGYDAYKDSAPGAMGMDVKQQTKNWSVPVHKGAVKALKEAGAWSDDQEKYSTALLKRQDTLISAWQNYLKTNPSSDEKKFYDGWIDARKAALAKANLPNE